MIPMLKFEGPSHSEALHKGRAAISNLCKWIALTGVLAGPVCLYICYGTMQAGRQGVCASLNVNHVSEQWAIIAWELNISCNSTS